MDWLNKLTGKKEPEKPKPKPVQSKPDTKTPDTETPKDFIEIGSSPVPGLTLRHVLRGHTGAINRIAWSPDGKYLASPSNDETIRIWDGSTGECVRVLKGHKDIVNTLAWLPNRNILVSGSHDCTLRLWDTNTWQEAYPYITIPALTQGIKCSPSESAIAVACNDQSVHLFSISTFQKIENLSPNIGNITSLDWAPDGKRLALGGNSKACIWVEATSKFSYLENADQVTQINWSKDGRMIAFQSDSTIIIWDPNTHRQIIRLEGHTRRVSALAFSYDGKFVVSASEDDTVRIWNTDRWDTLTVFKIAGSRLGFIALHPKSYRIATMGKNNIIHIWELDESVLLGQAKENVNYTTAKLVLVGDSGVGKTGLGWRLAHGKFKEHASTHGQQFWSILELGLKRKDGTDCEAVLWDLAGQHVYRQVHSIFLENVAAALVLFDPSNRQDPLKGAQFWLEQLKEKGKLPPTVLVGARVDRGAPALSQADLDQFCQRYGITGGYLSTSAMSGEGLETLLEKLKAQIPWEEMTATVTTITFKRIKDYVLSLKEKTDRKGVLVSPNDLQNLLVASDPDWIFSDAEMMTAVGHLETHGYITVLHNSAGEQYILLTPELLVNIAASIMLLADKNSRELGAVSETDLLQGKIPFDELKGLDNHEGQILLDAAILRFLEHSICFRETLGSDTLLIFPSLIKQKRPLKDDLPATDDISYVVRGRVENLYASLVVLLGYTPSFMRINQWQNQAQYEMGAGEVCGFRMIEEREGEIELVLYYDDKMPVKGREKYQELFEQFLYQRDVDVTRFPPVICKNGHQQKRATVIDRVREGKTFVFCDECGDKTLLPDFEKPQTIGIGASAWLQVEEAVARLRSSYEVHLTRVKSYRRTWATPRCYVSRLPNDAEWSGKLIHDLQDAGVYVIEKAEQVKPEDFLILLDTSAYRKAYQSSSSALAADPQLVKSRLKDGNKKVLALACEGNSGAHNFKECKSGEFCDETHYPVSLFDLVLNLYTIPFNHAGFAPLRQKLHEQWENTLAGKKRNDMTALKIFISYSHKDEPFKDELVTMLAGLQRRGIVDAWHDRRIEAGDEWYKSIQDAMNDCDLTLLLVSPDYLASRFIQVDEQPKLLKRREEMKTRVMPIIIRPCVWQSEETISSLQVMPKDGQAVIKFSKDNGDRDQVWADIATVIEKRAKK
jgi:small GTP-binding protein